MEPDTHSDVRLNRYLAGCGLGSRRECDRLIISGAVSVNGEKVKKLGVKIDPVRDAVTVRGKNIGRVLPLEYIAFHKPRSIMVTAKDPQGRETVYDVLRIRGRDAAHLKYVGRLDYASEGLLLMTNDGDLLHALTHPRFGIKKTYRVCTDRAVDRAHIELMTGEGVRSDGQVLLAGRIVERETGGGADGQWYEIDLYEGKNRQIRRMFEAFGYRINRLIRMQFGVVTLRDLPYGHYRELSVREVSGLRALGHRVTTARGKE
jgi:23S rRNA pseudouridine2605 synthase